MTSTIVIGPQWTGSGPILNDHCTTAEWSMFDLTTAYLWAPVIGCVADKPDCCPSSYLFSTPTTAAAATPTLAGQNVLPRCPDDYITVGSTGCCPYAMSSTNSLGGVAACATVFPTPVPAADVPSSILRTVTPSSGSPTTKPISTATTVMYALQYSITSDTSTGMSTAEKAGIGAGSGVGALALVGGAIWAAVFMRRRRRRRQEKVSSKTAATAGNTNPPEIQKKSEPPVVTGPAELFADDIKPTYELSNTPRPLAAVPVQQPHEQQHVPMPVVPHGYDASGVSQQQVGGQYGYQAQVQAQQGQVYGVPQQQAPYQQAQYQPQHGHEQQYQYQYQQQQQQQQQQPQPQYPAYAPQPPHFPS
ncbi:hypothetical protein B0T22DRAFT_168649 [Podospora appendiculata]|uniref:Uncharacterized protein n=1 Tax=Podospora appendiculata TaxID=314037 RepID=A0AAE1CD99_9PEZI|nr:hypothetical protein B0T22DRAFT_168649 [Podospora appendiculata]